MQVCVAVCYIIGSVAVGSILKSSQTFQRTCTLHLLFVFGYLTELIFVFKISGNN